MYILTKYRITLSCYEMDINNRVIRDKDSVIHQGYIYTKLIKVSPLGYQPPNCSFIIRYHESGSTMKSFVQ